MKPVRTIQKPLIALILTFLFLVQPSSAERWATVGEKVSIDTESITLQDSRLSVWVRMDKAKLLLEYDRREVRRTFYRANVKGGWSDWSPVEPDGMMESILWSSILNFKMSQAINEVGFGEPDWEPVPHLPRAELLVGGSFTVGSAELYSVVRHNKQKIGVLEFRKTGQSVEYRQMTADEEWQSVDPASPLEAIYLLSAARASHW